MCVFVSRPMKIATFLGKTITPQNGLLIFLGKETHSETKSWKSCVCPFLAKRPNTASTYCFAQWSSGSAVDLRERHHSPPLLGDSLSQLLEKKTVTSFRESDSSVISRGLQRGGRNSTWNKTENHGTPRLSTGGLSEQVRRSKCWNQSARVTEDVEAETAGQRSYGWYRRTHLRNQVGIAPRTLRVSRRCEAKSCRCLAARDGSRAKQNGHPDQLLHLHHEARCLD